MTASFTRTQREGETWIDLGNGKLLITHAERQPMVIDIDGIEDDDLLDDLREMLRIIDVTPLHPIPRP